MRTLIVGGGISGLTLATALRRVDIEVDLVEIRPDLSRQLGVGLSLQGNCIAALAQIGVAADCLQRGVPADYINLRRPDGSLVAEQPIVPMGGPAYPGTTGISRADLHEILWDAALAAGAHLKLGLSVSDFASEPDGVRARFSDGSVGRYDLMAAADGAHSATRDKLFPDVRPAPCGQSVWRAGVPRPRGCVTTELHLGGPAGVVGICPISADDAYLYVVETEDPWVRHPDGDLAAVMSGKLEAYTGELVRACVAHLSQSTALSYRPLEWLLLPAPWHRGRVLLIGDAAHCNPPVLAQGAAMGIEDAVVLAESLAQIGAVEAALAQFAARRFPRASLVVRNSVQLCEWEVGHRVSPQQVGRLMHETQLALAQPF